MNGLDQLSSSQLIGLLQQALVANTTLQAQVQQLQQENTVLREEIAALRGQRLPASTAAASGGGGALLGRAQHA
jgi:cell division protein FtsB